MTAGLCLPVGIDQRATAMADLVVIPHKCGWIDWLANRSKHAQAGEVMFLDPAVALFHKRPDSGRRGVENIDLVLVANIPEPAGIRIARYAFEHNAGSAGRKRAVDDIAVTGYAADIGCTEVRILFFIV